MLDPARGNGDLLMAGEHGGTALVEMGADACRKPLDRIGIERDERLIEYPERSRPIEPQARERSTTTLPLGQMAYGKVCPMRETHRRHCGADRRGRRRDAAESRGIAQVLRDGEVVLEAVGMTEKQEFAREVFAQRAGRCAAPGDLTRFGRREAGENAQQAGLATAVLALDPQEFSDPEIEGQVIEQRLLPADAGESDDSKHGDDDGLRHRTTARRCGWITGASIPPAPWQPRLAAGRSETGFMTGDSF